LWRPSAQLVLVMPRPLIGGGMLSDVCLHVAYFGPKSRTERHRKTKIGAEVADVTHDSGTTFQGQKVKVTRPLWLVVQVTT